MVVQIANKTSSSSTCVLVRMVMEGEILLSGSSDRCNPEPLFISFSCAPGPAVLLLSPPRTCYVLL